MTSIDIIKHRGFYPAETKVIRRVFHLSPRKYDRIRIPLFCDPVDLRSARIPQSDRTRHLIIRFPRRIIAGTSENFIFPIVFYTDKMGMSSGHNKAQKRRFQVRMFDIIRRNMSLDMVHADQRQIPRIRDRFRFGNSDKQRADQSRTVSHSDRINIIQCHFRFI